MIHQLISYAAAKGLVTEPGFAPKTARWAIQLSTDGQYLQVVELGDVALRHNVGMEFGKCPEMPANLMLGGGMCHFLVETAQVIVRFGTDTLDDAKREKVEEKHKYFLALLQGAQAVLPELTFLVTALSDEDTLARMRQELAAKRAKPTDKVTVCILGRTPTYLVDDPAWHGWWREYRRALAPNPEQGKKDRSDRETEGMRSFADGELAKPALTHPKIANLGDVGGSSIGSSLISFDKDSFCSYGLPQSANAAMADESAAAYRAALNELLGRSVKLAGARVAYWYKESVPIEDDPLAWLQPPADAAERDALVAARDLLGSVRAGARPTLISNRYHALTMGGNAGRAVVRDWIEGEFVSLVENVERWFSDLAIVHHETGQLCRPPRLEWVITSQLPPKPKSQAYDDWIRPVGNAREAFWHAALSSAVPIPHEALARCLRQTILDIMDPEKRGWNNIRLAVLKAYHLRKGDPDMQPYLNEGHPDAAYHCGRLMALLAGLQRAALGDVGAGVVQRFYAAASATPALVLGRLVRMSQSHLSKLAGDRPKLAGWYEAEIAKVHGAVKDGFPPVLSLDRQSLFALGYYQQIAARNANKEVVNE